MVRTRTKKWHNLESGQGFTEYGLLLFGIGIALILVLGILSDTIETTFFNVLCELRDLGRNSESCEIVDDTIVTFEGEEDTESPTALFVWNGNDSVYNGAAATDDAYSAGLDTDTFTYSFYGDRNPDDGGSILSDDNGVGPDALIYQWTFGDGSVDFTNSPRVTHTYTQTSNETENYLVTLTVIDTEGNRDTYGDIFTLVANNQPPIANFNSFCDPITGTCVFQSNSPASNPSRDPDGDDSNLVYQWNFGDGSAVVYTSDTQVDHTYPIATANSYRVQLTVTDERGSSSVMYKTIFIGTTTGNRPPNASYTITNCGRGDYTCTIDASTSSDDGLIQTYEFDPGTGTFEETFVSDTFEITFADPYGGAGEAGTYNTRLRVTDNGGPALNDIASLSITLDEDNVQPTVTLDTPTPTCTITRVCTVQATGADSDNLPLPFVVQWDFDYVVGNFNVDAVGANVDYTYPADGTYTIAVRVFDGEDYSTIETATVVVAQNDAPQITSLEIDPAVLIPTNQCSNDPQCTLTSVVDDENVGTVTFEWDIDNDGTADVTNVGVQTATLGFPGSGSYNVRLTVTDDIGQTDTTTVLVVIGTGGGGVGADSASARYLVLTESGYNGSSGVTCKFDGTKCTFRNTSTTSAAFLSSCQWDLDGDGSYDLTNACTDFTYDFFAAGSYDVTLLVTDSTSDTDSITKTVIVTAAAPTSNVTATYEVQTTSVNFSNTNPVTCYYNGTSCTFDSTASSDISTITTCAWDMDNDGVNDVGNNCAAFTYDFGTDGTKTVTMTATDALGATNSVTKTVNVQPPPASLVTANFQTQDGPSSFSDANTVTCTVNGTTCTFRSTSSTTGTSVDVCSYDVGADGSLEVADNCGEFDYDFGTAGTYTVRLTATDNEGESASITKTIIVPSTIVPQYEVLTDSGYDDADGVTCTLNGTSCTLQSTATTNATSVDTCSWDVGANGTNEVADNCANFTYDFGTAGTYSLRFVATDNTGNANEITKTITVPSAPTAIAIADFEVQTTSGYSSTDGAICQVGNGGNKTRCTFRNSSALSSGSITECRWDFDNNGSWDNIETNANKCEVGDTFTHKYPSSGTYTVRFQVTGSDGLSTDITRTIVVP